MNQSEVFGWGTAVLMSLLLHSILFMQSGARMGVDKAPVVKMPLITRLNFTQAEVIPTDLKTAEPKAAEFITTELNTAAENSRAVNKPIQKKADIQKIEFEKTAEPEMQVLEQPAVPQKLVSKPTREQPLLDSSEILLEEKRQQYLYQLLSHIESFKYYPRIARRRAIEGEIKISFTLNDDGVYQQLMIDGEQRVLLEATRQALESSLPLPLPPSDIGLSRQIEFTMVYSLRN